MQLLNVNFFYPVNKQWLHVTISRRLVVKVPPVAWGHSLWFVKQPFLHIVSDVFSSFPSIYSGTVIQTLQPRLLLVSVHSKEKSQKDLMSQLFLIDSKIKWKVITDIFLRKKLANVSLNSVLNCALRFVKSANKIRDLNISHQIYPRWSEQFSTCMSRPVVLMGLGSSISFSYSSYTPK